MLRSRPGKEMKLCTETLVGGSGEGGLAAALWEVGSNRMSWLLWIRSSGKGNPVFPGFRL